MPNETSVSPALGGFAVTPSDVTIFDNVGGNKPSPRSLYVGGAGNVAVRFADRSTITFSTVPAGTILPANVLQVLATGTTATGIVGLY